MKPLKLTPKQYDLLYMDVVEVTDLEKYPEDTQLVRELERGKTITITDNLLFHVSEFADRDESLSERTVYRNLYKKINKILIDSKRLI